MVCTVSLKSGMHGCPAQAYSAPVHSASVNSVAFAPHELGLILAAASSDGSISILTYHEGAWTPYKVRLQLLLGAEGERAQAQASLCFAVPFQGMSGSAGPDIRGAGAGCR